MNEEQTTNKNYRSKTLKDIENEIKRQRAFLAPYTQERIQTTIDSQVKKLHQALLDQRNQEQNFSLPILTKMRTVSGLSNIRGQEYPSIVELKPFFVLGFAGLIALGGLLDQRNQEQKKALIQRSMDILAPLCCLVLTLFAFWLVWGG